MEPPEHILEYMVLLENLNIPSSIISNEELLNLDSYFGRDKQRRLVLTIKRESAIIEDLKNHKLCEGSTETEELVTHFDLNRINAIRNSNDIIPSQHYYGPVTKLLFRLSNEG